MTQITKGDQAPDFNLPTDGDGKFSLSANRDNIIVLFFYPKDDTSGCTMEAIDFTAKLEEFEKLGAKVIGLSPDPVKKHDKFIAKHDLKVTLVSDEEKETLQEYGIWVEKSMYGRKYMGVERTTLMIDKSGTVVEAWHKVKVPGHVDEVLERLKSL
ncbi:MAG: peroxiredoxin [Rhizobiaceae bacterium]|nr:peroxiredoxin [Rhizobiaceae bacterium]